VISFSFSFGGAFLSVLTEDFMCKIYDFSDNLKEI
jgi:hypothetical protein